MKEAGYSLFYDRKMRKFIIKFFSGRLHMKFYNKLSKEVEDFKDL